MSHDPARLRLSKIRCLREALKCIEENKPLPEALCFVPKRVDYLTSGKGSPLGLYEAPTAESKRLGEIKNDTAVKVSGKGDDIWNNQGQWLQLTEESQEKFLSKEVAASVKNGVWIMAQSSKVSVTIEHGPNLMPLPKKALPGLPTLTSDNTITKWEEAVEHAYSLRIGGVSASAELEASWDADQVARLRQVPAQWNIDHDEELARFVMSTQHSSHPSEGLLENGGDLSLYIERLEVSSEESEVDCLMDGLEDSYWESDGVCGRHWIRLHVRPGIVVRRLSLVLDEDDGNFMPRTIEVAGGSSVDSLVVLKTAHLHSPDNDFCVLENQHVMHKVIELRIKRCFDEGVDTRVHGINIVPSKIQVAGLNRSIFNAKKFSSYPKLDGIPPGQLYCRAVVLKRVISLFDSVVLLIMPQWQYSIGSFGNLAAIRRLLFLSESRSAVMSMFLRESETKAYSGGMPHVHLNRRLAVEHRSDPSQDTSCKNALFNQIYEALKPERCGMAMDYRWPAKHDQWWECSFTNEGMIDQGGGFRETLCELGEELCPSSSDVPVPIPFFVRSPNQLHDSSNVYRDTYVPNPSCDQFAKYVWLGQLMGAMLRSREHLILALPPFVWKQLVNDNVTWEQDYATVDAAQVKMLGSLSSMDEDEFNTQFDGLLTFTVTLSDSTVVDLLPDGGNRHVTYAERDEYARLVRKARLEESKEQVAAIRRGLLKVVPSVIMDLLTWKELEQQVCGDADVPVEVLKRTAHYDDGLTESEPSVKKFWSALDTFTNEERSRFLRFVTGRRRLPASIWICPGRSGEESNGALPESATCSSTIFLPDYRSVKVAAEKIRYAAYHCMSIDTDLSPYD